VLVYLVCYYGTAGCSCVGGNHNSSIVYAAHDCGTGASRLGKRDTLGVQSCIAVVVGEVEAGHGCGDVGE
jgi:hypothetical protein